MIDLRKKDKEQVEEHRQAEIKKGFKHLGSSKSRAGHTWFEFNFVTGELDKATIHNETILVGDSYQTKKKINSKENCQYFQALNRKNAIKKLKSIGLWKD